MGLDPMEVLIVPRLLALIIGLPLLTFLSDLAALYGGGLVAWLCGDVSPDVYLSRLRAAISMNTFMVGIIKAPFMALIIGLIASMEGLAVEGSAESLGRRHLLGREGDLHGDRGGRRLRHVLRGDRGRDGLMLEARTRIIADTQREAVIRVRGLEWASASAPS